MDPIVLSIAIFSIVSSTTTITALLYDSAKKFKEGEPELQKQVEEFRVLGELFAECTSVFESGIEIPRSATGALETCRIHHNEFIKLVQQAWKFRESQGSISKFLRRARIATQENERRVAYNAFRDSVLLLRDISSESVTKVKYIYVRLLIMKSEYE